MLLPLPRSSQPAAAAAASNALQPCPRPAHVHPPTPPGAPAEERYEDTAAEGAEAEAKADAQQKGWLDKALTGGSSTLALAFLCNKALFPIRTPITLGLTPVVAR